MQQPFEKNNPNDYYELLDATPKGAKQIVASKKSEEQFGKELRDPIEELRSLCGIFEGYKQTGEQVFISKAEEYLKTWSQEYNPNTFDKSTQISLDQRYFAWVFIETQDCWDALSAEGKGYALILSRRVAQEEEQFWEQNTHHNNRFSYSLLTRMAAYKIQELSEDPEAQVKVHEVVSDFFKQVTENVFDDGSTLDFRERDAVHYQAFNQIAWESMRNYIKQQKIDIPEDIEAKLNAALEFSLSYITGNESHIEFVNSSHTRDKEIQGDRFNKPFDKNSFVARQLLSVIYSR